jgi:hypothetical protein
VKPEQASKELMRESSRPDNGEDQRCSSWKTEAEEQARRGIGHSTHTSFMTERGRSAAVLEVEQRLNRSRSRQKSEEPIVAMKPGNAGGAKGLWFGVRLDEPNERRLA